LCGSISSKALKWDDYETLRAAMKMTDIFEFVPEVSGCKNPRDIVLAAKPLQAYDHHDFLYEPTQ